MRLSGLNIILLKNLHQAFFSVDSDSPLQIVIASSLENYFLMGLEVQYCPFSVHKTSINSETNYITRLSSLIY